MLKVIRLIKPIFIIRFVIGCNLFLFFVHSTQGNITCSTNDAPMLPVYIPFLVIVVFVFIEILYAFKKIAEVQHLSSTIRGALFLFDSTYISLATITAFGFLYYTYSAIDTECISGLTAIYFSMVTFTTLGYGDLGPREGYELVAAGQGLLGYIVLGVIVGLTTAVFTGAKQLKDENT